MVDSIVGKVSNQAEVPQKDQVSTPRQSHGNWAILESVESPEGIKIKLNRRGGKSFPMASTRISRKQASEVGILVSIFFIE